MDSDTVSEAELLSLLASLDGLERTFNLASRFNIFEALNMVRSEIRHSRFLAYLLDPSQPHGLDDRFLKSVIVAAADSHPFLPVTKLKLAIADYSGARVYCERDHFDITVEVPSLGLLFVIENKIDADERDRQLEDYRSKAQGLYPNHIFFGCFLTPEGYEGEDAQWALLSYADIAKELKTLCATAALRPDVQMAVDHYLHLVEKRIMPSKELIDACKQIYRQHRAALDLIYQHGSESLLDYAYQDFHGKHAELSDALLSRKDYLSFVPHSWTAIEGFAVADRSRWEAACPIKFWFRANDTHVYLKLEVGPVQEGARFDRSRFVAELRQEFNVRESKRQGEIYTRILSKKEKFDQDSDAADLAVLLEKLWQQIQGDKVVATVEALALAQLPPIS